jgi:hypothetical protein
MFHGTKLQSENPLEIKRMLNKKTAVLGVCLYNAQCPPWRAVKRQKL